MSIPVKVKNYLKKTGLDFELIEHKKVYTAYDLAQTTRSELKNIAKTLFIKADSDYYLVVLGANRRLNIPKLKKLLKAKKVKMASEKQMAKKLKIKPGAITPFGGLYDIGLVLDGPLSKVKKAFFGAGSFTESLLIKMKDFIKKEEPVIGTIGKAAKLKVQYKKKPKKKKKKRKSKKKKFRKRKKTAKKRKRKKKRKKRK